MAFPFTSNLCWALSLLGMEDERSTGGQLRPVPSPNFICGRRRDVRSSREVSAEGDMLDGSNWVFKFSSFIPNEI